MFKYENIVRGKMKTDKLWDLYSNVNQWPEWDTEMQSVDLKGEFIPGTVGIMHIKNMPPLPFTLDEIEKEVKFTNSSKLGDITVQFGHFIIDEGNNEYTLKHTVLITGPNDEQLQGIGQGIVSNIPKSMEKLFQLSKVD